MLEFLATQSQGAGIFRVIPAGRFSEDALERGASSRED